MSEAGAISAQMAVFRQSLAIESLRMASEQQKSLISLLSNSVQNVPVSQNTGTQLDISV